MWAYVLNASSRQLAHALIVTGNYKVFKMADVFQCGGYNLLVHWYWKHTKKHRNNNI